MSGIFFELTIIICLAAFLSIVFRFLKQPPILAYILTGILVGPFGQLQFQNSQNLEVFAQFGIALLLFMLGLELKLKNLVSIGKSALLIGIPQIVITAALGFGLASLFNFSAISSFYIAVAVTFSSTILIVKLLSNKKDLQSLYGKISVGILLIQDLFAVFVLMFLSTITSETVSLSSGVGTILVKIFILFGIIIFLSRFVFPKVLDFLARSDETLFLFSLAWVFGLSVVVSSSLFGFSIAIAGFLAGISLANSSENFQIISRIRPLQDFFITIFFVYLGMQMSGGNLQNMLIPIIVFSAFVILVKPVIVMLIMGIFGHQKRTSFFTGLHMAQISEFSFIILFLGKSLGQINSDVVILVTLVGLISFAASTYMSIYTNPIYRIFKPPFGIFEFGVRSVSEDLGSDNLSSLANHVILVGADHMGKSILDALLDEDEKVIVVDFDPDVIKRLKETGVTSIFGDIADLDIQDRIRLSSAKLVISTMSDPEDTFLLLDGIKHSQSRAKVIVVASELDDEKDLYKKGADYVVLPHLLGGKHLAKMIKDDTLEKIDGRKAASLEKSE